MYEEDLRVTEVAKELRVGVSTVWRWLSKGVRNKRLESFHVGGKRYISRHALNQFLKTDRSTDNMSHIEAKNYLKQEM